MPGFDGFQVVRRGRFGRRRFVPRVPGPVRDIVEPEIDTERLLRTVLDAVISLRNSPYRQIIYNGLAESLNILNKEVIPEIVCYGLGNFSECRAAKYQLAALLTIKSRYQSRVHLYDPVFFSKEIEVLKTLGLFMIETNERALRKADDNLTLFYMPHLCQGLIANCVYANRGIDLNNCIFMTNSFTEIAQTIGIDEDFKDSVEMINKLTPFVHEISINNDSINTEYPLNHAFNSTSIHVFPKLTLSNVPEEFWNSLNGPPYSPSDEINQRRD
ncbi:SRR1-like protein [Chelonus insularis]|uniref:SRR1-like protein n=1 Tax=Chelonus insularis TaxID=460826 RepID=UPI0015898958|nr:SRR1-like protein [Chelonus insularis]XP_034940536.1 SRR1-like protein [Chelonus insularis]